MSSSVKVVLVAEFMYVSSFSNSLLSLWGEWNVSENDHSYTIEKHIMFRHDFLVPCQTALEPEARGEISNADHVFT